MTASARLTDPIAHSHAMGGLITGLVVGALVGAAIIATGGLALVAVAGAAAAITAGAGVGQVIGSMHLADSLFGVNTTGAISAGSGNVFINSKPAARALLDIALCSTHAPVPSLIAQGSATVFINGKPMARVSDPLSCGAKIASGSPNVFAGGGGFPAEPQIEPEIPAWVNHTLMVVGLGSAVVLAGPIVAGLGLVGGFLGGEAGKYLGGKWFGEGSDGQKWMMLGGGLIGGFLGAKGGTALGNKYIPNPTTPAAAFTKGGMPAVSKLPPTVAASERPLPCKCQVGEPIDIVSGEVILEQTDFALPGSLPIGLQRTHISGYTKGTVFGSAWASTWGQWIEMGDGQNSDILAWHDDQGTSLQFEVPGLGETVPHRVYRSVRLTRLENGFMVQQGQQAARYFTQPDGAHWRLSFLADRNGQHIAFIYDNLALVEVRHSSGDLSLRVETQNQLITRIALWQSNGSQADLVNFQYDADQQLQGIINSSGLALTYAYERVGSGVGSGVRSGARLTRWQDRNGVAFGYRYDSQGRCVETMGGGGYLTGWVNYDSAHKRNSYTNALGHSSVYEYDDSFQVVRQIDARGGITEHEYDDWGNPTITTLPNGVVLRSEYDEHSNLISFMNALDQETAIRYNDLDLPVCITTPDGTSTLREYDARGNLTASQRGAARTKYEHDGQGNVVCLTNPTGAKAHFEHNSLGLVTLAADFLGHATHYRRDAFGRVVARTDAQGHISQYRYNPEGKLTDITLPDGSHHSAVYDAEGNRVSQTDALGHTTQFEYGAFDVLSKTIEANGAVTQYRYDAELRLAQVINPEGHVWQYRHNATGQVIEETDFSGYTTRYQVDALGYVAQKTGPAGQTTRYRRNAAGQVLEQIAPEGRTHFTYDPMGRLLSAISPDAELRFERDELGQIIAESQNGHTIRNSYNLLGQRMRRESAGGHASVWEFDANGLLLGLDLPDAQSFDFSRDSLGNETTRHLPGEVRIDQEFDSLGRVTRQYTRQNTRQSTPGNNRHRTLQERAVNYNRNGLPQRLGDRTTGVVDIAYDNIGQVTSAKRNQTEEQYAYDLAGNLIEAIKQKSLFAHDDNNADAQGPRQHQHGRLTQAGKVKYEYDAAGRVITRIEGKRWGKQQTWRYEWNSANRLTQVTTPDGDVWAYRYDALGRRLSKKQVPIDPRQSRTEIDYLWDGHTLAQERKVCKKPGKDGTGFDILDSNISTWDYEPDSFRPLAKTETRQHKGQTTRQIFAVVLDHIGTPKELISADGDIAWQAKTNLWGEVEEITVSKTDCPIRFQGQYFDEESKLAYNWHRYYDPSSGRYLTPDPLGLQGGPNPYAYVANPLAGVDPLGLMGVCGNGSNNTSKITSGSQVTESMIREAMQGAELTSQQPGGISLPRVQTYVDRLLAGEKPGPINVDNGFIIDGNHRYVAGRIVGQEPPIQPWAGARPSNATPWDKIPISPEVWDW
jgi:RHS repeat-associated protein